METAKIEFATSRKFIFLDAKRALYQLSYVPGKSGISIAHSTLSTCREGLQKHNFLQWLCRGPSNTEDFVPSVGPDHEVGMNNLSTLGAFWKLIP